MSNYPPPPPGQPPYPPQGQPTSPMNPQPPYQQPPYQQNPYQQQPPYPPPGQPPKKGGAGKWILIGCIGFMLIGGMVVGGVVWYGYNKAKQMGLDPDLARRNPALAIGKIAIKNDPDKELISVDETNNTITVRDKKSGKVVTLTVDQDKNGKVVFKQKDASGQETVVNIGGDKGIEVTTPDGKTTIGGGANATLPDWFPAYPGAKIKGTYSNESDTSDGKGFSFETSDSVAQVASFYEERFKGAGFRTSKTTSETNGTQYVTISGSDSSYKRFFSVMAHLQDGQTTVMITATTTKKK